MECQTKPRQMKTLVCAGKSLCAMWVCSSSVFKMRCFRCLKKCLKCMFFHSDTKSILCRNCCSQFFVLWLFFHSKGQIITSFLQIPRKCYFKFVQFSNSKIKKDLPPAPKCALHRSQLAALKILSAFVPQREALSVSSSVCPLTEWKKYKGWYGYEKGIEITRASGSSREPDPGVWRETACDLSVKQFRNPTLSYVTLEE